MRKNRTTVDELFLNTENTLYNYNFIKTKLNNYKLDLEYLNIDYKKCKTSNQNNTNTLLLKEIKELKNKINLNEKQIKKIDNALNLLSEEEKSLVKYRYFSKLLTPPC